MTDSYDLSKLGPEAFENMVNFLALKTLGLGSTGFGPGADGGRDGYFKGEAPYPSETERWKGVWYIQSKFHKPHLSTNPQKWLVQQVTQEIEKFDAEDSDRIWPDNWIIATNIDQSGKPETGSFDLIRKLLDKSDDGKKVNLAVWGGRKILDLLALHSDVAIYYGHLLTPGHLISTLYSEMAEKRASIEEIVRYFIVTQFTDHTYCKLDQAGSSSDVRPGVHDLFIDLPFITAMGQQNGLLSELCKTSAQCHRYSLRNAYPESWRDWHRCSKRARVALIKGGPGQGKSTIGQYLCQIHRASILLPSDGPRVNDTIKNIAKEVRTAAMRDGFWPTSPRIPIQIELKEFAHWYSQRATSLPRDVLSYLAETIAKKVLGDVLAKTIKNALGKRSWIVIFDGLDEVPNDFKDAIAGEILLFLNDLLVEIDGDVLALCTSRPQGYSGQFSGIDGPVIELSQLDAETAIRCAKPLLQFGRNSDESDKSIKILEAAILSPNVKELMTTPLQSHIMAVVVRDGGRPPERRWQLFNSFYLVMKKRESLKNFQNPRIAKLLREEDRLLKSVHMRLGFVLHARAERSEGAQTTLSKDEFKSLVHDVVTELDSHDIDATVADVMEATTERLVLVSTPENGEQVRFDIRQLQEFFAAEFLYAGVDSKELASRIETIGGDEHWREVMHFLMSALIENQRTADVAVAVQELRRLNEGDEANNLYRRRMARAVLLGSRLLIEGVLEQDQRDRQSIKPLFDPLGSAIDLESLQSLGRIKPTRSRQWLIQLLLEKILTANPQEYIGSLYLLAWLLPDDHIGGAQAFAAFFKTPINFQENLFGLWSSHVRIFDIDMSVREQHKEPLSQWIIEAAIRILNSSDWIQYKPDTVRHLLNICSTNKDRFTSICKMKGFNENVAEAITQCLPAIKPKHDINTDIDCGVLSATSYKENWCNGAIPKKLAGIDAQKYLSEVDGAFRLMLTCVWFAKKQSDAAIVEIVKAVDVAGVARLEALPDDLLALLPIPGAYDLNPYDIEHLRSIEASTIGQAVSLAKSKKLQTPLKMLMIKSIEKPSQQDWKSLANHLPGLVSNLIFNIAQERIFPWGKETALGAILVPEIRNALLESPNITSRYILNWGILYEKYPDLLNELKRSVRDLPPMSSNKSMWLTVGFINPYKLVFPEDAPLLSLIAPPLTYWRLGEGQRRQSKEPRLSFRDTLLSFGLDAKKLRAITESAEYNQTTRAGALALFWLLFTEPHQPDAPQTILNLVHEQQLYTELVNEFNEPWLAQALVSGLLINTSESDENVLAFVTYLMERCADGGGPRKELIGLLVNWRERSTAPVHSKGVLKKWLGYNFQPPTYACT